MFEKCKEILLVLQSADIYETKLNEFLCRSGILMHYSRGGQSAALQRFSAAPVSNFECTTHKFTSIYIFMYEKIRQKLFLRPSIQYFNEIWPARRKVRPPLHYSIKIRNQSYLKNLVKEMNKLASSSFTIHYITKLKGSQTQTSKEIFAK